MIKWNTDQDYELLCPINEALLWDVTDESNPHEITATSPSAANPIILEKNPLDAGGSRF